MPALLKKYPTLLKTQSPFKQLSDIEKMVKKERASYAEFHANPNADKSHIKFFTRKCSSTNVPINVGSLDEMYEEMRKAVKAMSGINFVLGMQTDDGNYQVWKRPNQPCQGGEMRKYGITHDDCTRPKDRRPGDLTHPFPDGKPIAVGSKVENLYKSHQHQIHPNSIYRRAYGTEDNVEIVKSDKDLKQCVGLIALNADLVDPTMMVHMLRDARNWRFKEEAPPQVAFLLNKAENYIGNIYYYSGNIAADYNQSTYHYHLPSIIMGGVDASRDLTGGSLGNRFDYNRPDIEYAYRGEVGTNTHIQQIINEGVYEGKSSNVSYNFSNKKDVTEVVKRLSNYFKI